MLVSEFDFELPKERIADRPADPRESAKLLHVTAPDTLEDLHIADLPDVFRPSDLLVFNDTKVIPARLFGKRGDASVEATLFKSVGLTTWEALVKNARRLHSGDIVSFYPPLKPEAEPLQAKVVGRGESGTVILEFLIEPSTLFAALEQYGVMPLPPYIHRKQTEYGEDKANYQTVYAENPGAVAAPTAGLHFTKELLAQVQDMGVGVGYVTLHVGLGTFRPVKEDEITDHEMHSEYCVIPQETAELINRTHAGGGRVICVGTTSCRTVESWAGEDGTMKASAGWTNIFIYPGYRFKVTDALITNFHLPESTLIMLVSALAGREHILAAYQEAVREKYRFFSFGDAMFIH